MNQRKNRLPQAHEANELHCQQTRNPQPHNAGLAQPKMMTSQMKTTPVAPPVYRPQPAPKALQPKTAHVAQQPRQPPVAPPAYRSQPTPRVLQPKKTGVNATGHPAGIKINLPTSKPGNVPRIMLRGNSIQRYAVSSAMAFGDTGVGRSQNAGIVDTQFTHTGAGGREYNITAHYHANGWTEAARTFTSLTGTFVADGNATRFHYTLSGDGTAAEAAGRWEPYRPLSWDANAAQRTRDKLAGLLAYVAPAVVV